MNSTPAESTGAPSQQSWEFAEDYVPLTEGVRLARDEATLSGLTPISPGVAATLTVLAATTQAKLVVEIGTAMGASALALFEGMADGGVLTSIDAETDAQLPARKLLTEAGYTSSRFRLIAGNPLEVLPKLNSGAYDIVFVNGDKLEYVEYVANAERLLRSGGLLVVNDVLWHNQVADPDNEGDEAIIIREALQAVSDSDAYQQTLLPVGNGLLVAVKN
ncbi:O-methyltransferase [Tessaracoccus sp. OS52]|uniref:O-methyltransferase n=1 Tax=Tessaracoccus sp. OS52 TaxID=2886691 RepID=UPI001D10B5B9|nr:O-methyltransferase [Tessaracoccus sp. OS52]